MEKTVVILTGPTAVGKTDLSIEIAKKFDTEIISCDSRQFYKELKIGSAPPNIEQLNQVKHHFIGHLSINDHYNVGKYEIDSINKLNELFKKKNIVVLTGGSGLYIDIFCNGMDNLPDSDSNIRAELFEIYKSEGISKITEELKSLDIETYNTIDLNNFNRVQRAIEVCIISGKKYSDLKKQATKKREFNIIKILLERPREELYQRINNRVLNMIEDGLVNEAKSLYSYRNLNSLNTVGYKEIFPYIENIYNLDRAIELIQRNTRRFAKRQLTWFRKDKNYKSFHPSKSKEIISYLLKEI